MSSELSWSQYQRIHFVTRVLGYRNALFARTGARKTRCSGSHIRIRSHSLSKERLLAVFFQSLNLILNSLGGCKRLLHCFSITLAADLSSLTYLSSSENFATQYEPTDTSTSSASTLLTPELIFCLRSSKLYNNNKQKLEVSSPPN